MVAIEREPTRYAHGEGHADLVIDPTVTEYPGHYITCGGDGEIRIWNGLEDDSPVAISLADVARGLAARPLPAVKPATTEDATGETAADAPVRGRFVAGSADTLGVHAFDLPDATPDGILTRFTADVNCLRYSPDGSLLAAGAGDFNVKIIRDSDGKATTLTGHSAPVLSLAFDPSGTRLASAACNGDVKIWNVVGLNDEESSSSSVSPSDRCLKTMGGIFPFSNDFDNTQTLCRLCWSPDGSRLLVPAVGGVKVFNADSWDFQYTFTAEDLTVANVTCFTPCGKYFAVSSTNGYLVIFDYIGRNCVAKCETDKKLTICAMVWNPTVPTNKPAELIICDVEGNLGAFKCRLGSSSKPASAAAKKATAAKDGVEDFQGLFDDDDDFDAAAASQKAMDDDGADDAGGLDLDGADDVDFRADGVASRADSTATSVPADHVNKVYVESYSGPKLTPPQDSFQPSATPRHLSNRFMVWNSLGIVTQHKSENAIDVEFHDTAIHHAIHYTNDDNHIMADLNQNLVALASEADDDGGGASKLTVLHIASWDSSKQWSVVLPDEEVAEAIAVGFNWVAVATSKRLLRIFSAAGIQREILCLPGPVVCMAGFESQLLVASHDGVGMDGDQKMTMHHYRRLGTSQPYSFFADEYPLVLSAKSTLEWLGFSFEGSPVTVDSAGVVRLTKRRLRHRWIQIADTWKNVGKSDHYFVIAVSERDAHLRCIFCKGCAYPPVLPKPLVQTLPLTLPLAEPETDKGAAEAAFWVAAATEEHEDTESTMQEQLLKLVALSCKSDRDFRATEAASLFPSAESLQIAIKYASRLKKMNLAARFGEIALQRRQEETSMSRRKRRKEAEDEEEEEDEERELPPDSQMSLFDDSPPSKTTTTSSSKPPQQQWAAAAAEEEAEEDMDEDDDGEEEEVPLLQLEKSSKPLTPLVATAQDAAGGNKAGNNPFKKQMSFDAADGGGGKNVFAALAQPTLLKKASSFSSAAGSRFSKSAGQKKGGDDVIKPPPVKRKPAAGGSQGGKKASTLARSFESQQRSATAAKAAAKSAAVSTDSIVTSTPIADAVNKFEDESPFAFWKRCNLEAILADMDESVAEDDEDAVTQHCVKKFREMPTADKKEWIAKFNTQKQLSQKSVESAKNLRRESSPPIIVEQDANIDAAAAANGKKRKLEVEDEDGNEGKDSTTEAAAAALTRRKIDDEEDKEQKPPTVKSRLAAFAFAGDD